MKVTEQIDTMEVSGTNPFKYLIATVSWHHFYDPVLTVYAVIIPLMAHISGEHMTRSM